MNAGKINWERMWELAKQPSDGGYHKQRDYIAIILSFFTLFWAIYYLMHKVCVVLVRTYRDMSNKKRADYLSRWNAIVHAVVVTGLAYIGCFHMCDQREESIFTDYQCLVSPKNYH